MKSEAGAQVQLMIVAISYQVGITIGERGSRSILK